MSYAYLFKYIIIGDTGKIHITLLTTRLGDILNDTVKYIIEIICV